MIERWLATICLATLMIGGLPGSAAADELADFQQALRAYESQDYSLAAALFENLVGGEQPRLQNRALVLESRKYLAASYLFLGRTADAERQFDRLLHDDPSYQLDPLAFPEEVQTVFNRVRKELEGERRAEEESMRRAEEQANLRKAEKERAERKKLLQLVNLAETERVERVHSRWIALIPFGVGQFQNGDKGWGVFFAVSEGIMTATAITAYFLHEYLRGQHPKPESLNEARLAEKAFRYTNQISMGVLGVLIISGIIDAQARFHPIETESRPRMLPQELRDGLKLSAGLSGVSASVNF